MVRGRPAWVAPPCRKDAQMTRSARTLGTTLAATATLLLGIAGPANAADTTESVAHRGDRQYHAENSVAGIASAVVKDADWIEIDVRYNPSGDTFFLAHDNSCSGPGGSATISSAAYATVVDRCALPELDDVLADFDAQGYRSFVVELKDHSSTRAAASSRLVETIEDAGVADDVWISSLTDAALAGVRDTGTDIDLMRVRNWTGPFNVSQSYINETVALGYDGINVNVSAWTQARVDYAEDAGLTTVGWTAGCACTGDNTTAIEIGLDLFMTDRLDDLHTKLGR